MQSAEADNLKSRGDEESINFRPSPNFKHMKKYLKSKFEETNQMVNPGTSTETPGYSSHGHEDREKVNENPVQEVQPPLPPNPPPPDTPPQINVKKEIEDEETQYNKTENTLDFNQPEQLMTDMIKTDQSEAPKVDQSEGPKVPELQMCRNFARGACKKGASCIFAHQLILSQLPGVYTFCRNFQNSVCVHPKCKFVHATVFEKEYFFRTGYLPPHTLNHLKEANVMPPPPPPPPLPEDTPTEVPQMFSNVMVPPSQPCITPVPVLNCAVAPSMETNDSYQFRPGVSPFVSPKRDWSDGDNFSSSSFDFDAGSSAKKCKNCDNSEFRYQYHKNKVEKMTRSCDEIKKNIAHLTEKNNKINSVLMTLITPMAAAASSSTGLNSSLNIGPEKEMTVLDQMNLLLAASNRLPFMGEENNQNLSSNSVNFTNLLARLLLNSADPNVAPNTL